MKQGYAIQQQAVVQIQIKQMAQIVVQMQVAHLVFALVILVGLEQHAAHQFAHQLVVDMGHVLHLMYAHVIQVGVDQGVRLNSNDCL